MSNILAAVSSASLVAVPFSNPRAFRFSWYSNSSFKVTSLPRTPGLSSSKAVQSGLFQLKRRPIYGFGPVHAKDINAGQWDNERHWLSHEALVLLNDVFERLPKPVKVFPWSLAIGHLVQTIFGLAIAVVKCLCVPVLVLTSLGEMSYCAQERKMSYIPFPFLAGIAVASILKQTVTDLSPDISKWEYPWHLLLMALFFVLLKLPGPYYPYLGRLIIPHFANGGLWSILWFIFQWNRVTTNEEYFQSLNVNARHLFDSFAGWIYKK